MSERLVAVEKELREALRAIVSEFNRDNIPAVQAAFNMVNIAQRALDSESCKHTGAVRWKDDWSGIEALSADFVRDEDHDDGTCSIYRCRTCGGTTTGQPYGNCDRECGWKIEQFVDEIKAIPAEPEQANEVAGLDVERLAHAVRVVFSRYAGTWDGHPPQVRILGYYDEAAEHVVPQIAEEYGPPRPCPRP